MSRSVRLFDLIQSLRRHRRAVSAAVLADELEVSKRTIYRDIETLIALGAPIEGEAGVGYVLRPGFLLPPLMFTEDELEALALGGRWVAQRADRDLVTAAEDALAKIAAVLPVPLTARLEDSGLIAAPGMRSLPETVDPAVIRAAIRRERKLRIAYTDEGGAQTERTVWPIALVYFEATRLLSPGAKCASAFAISAPTGSPVSPSSMSAIPRPATHSSKLGRRMTRAPTAGPNVLTETDATAL